MKERNFFSGYYLGLLLFLSVNYLVLVIFTAVNFNKIREPTKEKPNQLMIGIKIDNNNINNIIDNDIQKNNRNTKEIRLIEFDVFNNKYKLIERSSL